MEGLFKSLPAILEAAGASAEVAEAACKVAWKPAVGEALSVHARAMQLEEQTLIVAVADNIWQRQLEVMRPQLLFRLNSVLGKPLVKLIQIRVAPEVFKAREVTESKSPNATSASAPFEILAAACEIQDASLRRAFLGAARSCIERVEK
jgi:predicted nucleic acid-binding Zn ribbon protein